MLAMKPDAELVLCLRIALQAVPELDHYYALDIENGDHFKVNESAYWVLENIASGVTITNLVPRFAEEYNISTDAAEKDLHEVIAFALENRIVEEVDT